MWLQSRNVTINVTYKRDVKGYDKYCKSDAKHKKLDGKCDEKCDQTNVTINVPIIVMTNFTTNIATSVT
jgi:hypothetical protein